MCESFRTMPVVQQGPCRFHFLVCYLGSFAEVKTTFVSGGAEDPAHIVSILNWTRTGPDIYHHVWLLHCLNLCDCHDKMPWIGWLIPDDSLFLAVLEAGRFKIKVLACSVSGESLLPTQQLVFTGRKREGPPLLWSRIPPTRAPLSNHCFEDLHLFMLSH